MAKISEDEFKRSLDSAIQEATAWQQSEFSEDRIRNYRYYAGHMPPGAKGRSQAVSWDVFETIESAMPDLLEIFLSGDNIGEFEPVGVDDEQYAEQATDYINYVLQKQNPGFLIFTTWIKDALLSKIGVVRAYWAKSKKVIDKEYTGLTEDQLAKLLRDDSIEVIEQESYNDPEDAKARKEAKAALNTLAPDVQLQVMAQLDMPKAKLYDVKLRRTIEKGRVYIDNVQPENFIITPRAKTIGGADLVGEFKALSRSDMLELGYKKSDIEEAQSYDAIVLDEDSLAATISDDGAGSLAAWGGSESNDEATETIVVFDGFIRIDYDGDGIAEYRHVVQAGNVTLVNEQAEGPDFAVLSPILIPHRLVGLALADTVAPIQDTSTAIQRQYLDALFIANNPRTYAIDNQVNMDDLLNPRIGGVVRIKSQNAVGPLITSVNNSQSSLEGIEFMDSRRELRTGITRYNQGLDADSLNKTATGVTKIMSAGDRRKVMMARIMAETGVKDLFRLLLRIVTDNQDKPATVRLGKEWVEIDPSPWSPEMDVTIETARGSGDKAQLIGVLQMVLQSQKEGMAARSPLVTWKHIYNTMHSILKAAGIKTIDKYVANPDELPAQQPQQPEKTPEQALAEATIQAEQIKAQVRMKELEANTQIKAAELQMKQIDLQIKQADLKLKELELGHKVDVDQHKAAMDLRQENRKDVAAVGQALGVI